MVSRKVDPAPRTERSGGSGTSRVSFAEHLQGPSLAASFTPSFTPTPSPRRSAGMGRPNGNPKDAPQGPQSPQSPLGHHPSRTPSARTPNGLPKGRGAPGSKLTNGRVVSKGSSIEAQTASGESGSRSGSH